MGAQAAQQTGAIPRGLAVTLRGTEVKSAALMPEISRFFGVVVVFRRTFED
jgi:hypothetical protein